MNPVHEAAKARPLPKTSSPPWGGPFFMLEEFEDAKIKPLGKAAHLGECFDFAAGRGEGCYHVLDVSGGVCEIVVMDGKMSAKFWMS